jgi:hypothetical protein
VSQIPAADWIHLGSSTNADFYQVEQDILAVVPYPDTTDDGHTARESLAFQRGHWAQVGHRGGVVVFMDPVLVQDASARAVYANETADHPSTCFALVSSTLFGQATASTFEGLTRPGVPTHVFRTFEEALPWVHEMNTTRAAP